jgi:hypothetical protein
VIPRALIFAGAAATLLSAFLPWVTVKGLPVTLDLGLVGAEVSLGSRTVAGTDTVLWPGLVAIALVVAALGLFGVAWRLVFMIGLIVSVAGGVLLFYVANVIDLETRGSNQLMRAAADALLSSSIGPGTPLMLGGGLAIIAGSLLLAR